MNEKIEADTKKRNAKSKRYLNTTGVGICKEMLNTHNLKKYEENIASSSTNINKEREKISVQNVHQKK